MDVTARIWVRAGLALIALLGLAAPASARDVPRDFYGAVLDGGVLSASPDVLGQQWGQMAASGVETVRTVFSWADAQPLAGGPFDFTRTDALVADAAANRIDLLPVVIYAPPWARKDASQLASP